MTPFAKFRLLALSFALSLILWVYVQVQENPIKPAPPSYTLPIVLKNLPENLVVVSKPDTIKIYPRGPLDERGRIKQEDLGASVDLKNAKKGIASYPIELEVPGDVAVKFDPKAPMARIEIQERISRDVPVMVETSGQLSNPEYFFRPESTFASPQTVRITGPEKDANRVVAAYADLDLSVVTGPGKAYTGEVYLVEDQDRPAASTVTYEPKTVQIHPAISVGLEVRSMHVLPLYRGEPAPGFQIKSVEITPEDVLVRGKPEVLASIAMLRPEIDLTGLKETTTLTVAADKLPRGLTPSTSITARIVIEPIVPAPPKTTEPAASPKGHRRRTRG